ncbi:MAG TPA: hypothetical protein VGO90_07255 [Chthoniobacteraceae bacterium]|nr:hypothetical protein [Chthoniobacteraceae bacterium]
MAARFLTLSALTTPAGLAPMNAEVIDIEGFNYPNGSIDGRAGGSGWNQSGDISSWNGDAVIQAGALQTTSTAFSETLRRGPSERMKRRSRYRRAPEFSSG